MAARPQGAAVWWFLPPQLSLLGGATTCSSPSPPITPQLHAEQELAALQRRMELLRCAGGWAGRLGCGAA